MWPICVSYVPYCAHICPSLNEQHIKMIIHTQGDQTPETSTIKPQHDSVNEPCLTPGRPLRPTINLKRNKRSIDHPTDHWVFSITDLQLLGQVISRQSLDTVSPGAGSAPVVVVTV